MIKFDIYTPVFIYNITHSIAKFENFCLRMTVLFGFLK
jgi:hypothetical protein